LFYSIGNENFQSLGCLKKWNVWGNALGWSRPNDSEAITIYPQLSPIGKSYWLLRRRVSCSSKYCVCRMGRRSHSDAPFGVRVWWLICTTSDCSMLPTTTRPSHLESPNPMKGRPHWSVVQTETTRPEVSSSSNVRALVEWVNSARIICASENLCPAIPPMKPRTSAPSQTAMVFTLSAFPRRVEVLLN